MKNLLKVVQAIRETSEAELAADYSVPDNPTPDEYLMMYQATALARANAVLDKQKNLTFAQVLNLKTRGAMERAIDAYDKDFLLGLGLSLEATGELAENLIQLSKRFKVVVPDDWKDVAAFRNIMQVGVDTSVRRKLAEV